MTDVAAEIAEIRKTIEIKRVEHARAQARAEAARTGLEEARTALRDHFGVETMEDAKAKHQALEGALQTSLAALRSRLSDA